ncbi:PREDICTED: uncharacterized protein LOC106549348 [Thamnophis sirtalis]|uniref:Uncharacterized protein LOC106549348 n=1 Tax=Thamnophis sirtalis TaxID=35019 RepID=A0A6I9YEI2_9SAUR|nr:PREDICTED: uncharacterized protein LOC106549348 [Thamnophis sirtalis]
MDLCVNRFRRTLPAVNGSEQSMPRPFYAISPRWDQVQRVKKLERQHLEDSVENGDTPPRGTSRATLLHELPSCMRLHSHNAASAPSPKCGVSFHFVLSPPIWGYLCPEGLRSSIKPRASPSSLLRAGSNATCLGPEAIPLKPVEPLQSCRVTHFTSIHVSRRGQQPTGESVEKAVAGEIKRSAVVCQLLGGGNFKIDLRSYFSSCPRES